MSAGPIACLVLMAVWAAAACALPFMRQKHRSGAVWALIVVGVPLAGWTTYCWGPGPGVLSVALAVLLLMRPPIKPRQQPRGRAWSAR